MSQSDSIPAVNKTIRIPVDDYHELVELTGLLSAVMGHNFSISETASWAIQNTGQQYHEKLVNLIGNSSEIKKLREALSGQTGDIINMWKHVRTKEKVQQ